MKQYHWDSHGLKIEVGTPVNYVSTGSTKGLRRGKVAKITNTGVTLECGTNRSLKFCAVAATSSVKSLEEFRSLGQRPTIQMFPDNKSFWEAQSKWGKESYEEWVKYLEAEHG